jgi:hypothetical protein
MSDIVPFHVEQLGARDSKLSSKLLFQELHFLGLRISI